MNQSMSNPEDIFEYSRNIKFMEDQSFRDPLATNFIKDAAIAVRSYFNGSKGKFTRWKRLKFESKDFATLSFTCRFEWRDLAATFDLSCPESPHLNKGFNMRSVRLYTLHPLVRRTIFTTTGSVLSFEQPNVLYKFLSKDYVWFAQKFRDDYASANNKEQFDSVLYSVRTAKNEEEAGRHYAAHILKDVFKNADAK